ncbi:hypothetical protein ACVWZZ_004529 [Bradyrhizobium sp. LM6.10]
MTFKGSRKQLVDLAAAIAADGSSEEVADVSERVDIVQLADFDQRRDGGPMLGSTAAARERRIFPIERNWTDGAFHDIVVELDPAIMDEVRQILLAREGITHVLRKLALLAYQTVLWAQPVLEYIGEWLAFLLLDA